MAEEQDQSQKTEQPTERRLDEARRRGQVPNSREVNHVFMLGAATLLVGVLAGDLAQQLGDLLLPFIEAPHSIRLDPPAMTGLLAEIGAGAGMALVVPVLLFLAAAIASGVVQNGLVASTEVLLPKLERISPVAGLKRLFSLRQLVEFAKGLAKVALVTVAAGLILWPSRSAILAAVELEAGPLAATLGGLMIHLLGGTTLLIAVVALLDVAYQRFEHRKQLRMSRRDLQDEYKQTEGDPHLKARLKSLRLERARRRMMAAVPDATVVITNPTHFAVALRFEAGSMAAPRVVAKGVDGLALKIREVARASRVPVVENPPLARALHRSVELADEIPPAHYQAVAEIIGRIMQLSRTG